MPLLEIKNLVKYYGDTLALNDINLSVKKGEVVVILGPSGCGKSTLLRCINGLEEIKSGQLILQNEGVLGKDLPWVKARQHIGMVFQSYELFPHMSVIDNILLGPLKVQKRQRAEVEAQADMLLKRVGLFDRKNAYPRELSGGQKQRVALARTLLRDKPILLLDEPFSALDPKRREELQQLVAQLCQERNLTLLMVTHQIEESRALFDRIICIENGKIISG